MGFFDKYSIFYNTSETSPYPDRLNLRYEAIFGRNVGKIKGKRVLDIASHDGRWTFAALKAGAAHVTGVEPRRDLVDNAKRTLAAYEIDPSSYQFVVGDVFEFLQGESFDVVLCLGFFYHTIRHAELFDLMERTGASFLVIDTEVTPPTGCSVLTDADPRMVFRNPYSVHLLQESVDSQQMAWRDSLTRNGVTLVGRPSREVVKFMANHFGFTADTFDWRKLLHDTNVPISTVADYDQGWRATFFCQR